MIIIIDNYEVHVIVNLEVSLLYNKMGYMSQHMQYLCFENSYLKNKNNTVKFNRH